MRTLLEALPVRQAFADIVSVLLPRTEAGACVPENGQFCSCEAFFIGCDPYRCYWSFYRTKFNCNGACIQTSQPC